VSDTGGFPELNGPQRRHFEVVFASLEDALVRVEQLAATTVPDARLLTERDADVRKGFTASAGPLIGSIRARLGRLVEAMDLGKKRPSTTRTIHALLNAQIIHLQDSNARRLSAYGNVDPRAATTLDPELQAIEHDLFAILDALRVR
jgi:hypothetical protein